MRHTKDTLDVFLFLSRNRVATTEELAQAFSRSRYWCVGVLKLLAESGLAHETKAFTFEAWYASEVDALRHYVATVEAPLEAREDRHGTENDS